MYPPVPVPTSFYAHQFLSHQFLPPPIPALSSSCVNQFLCQPVPVPKSSVPTSSCPISMDLFLEIWWLKLINFIHCWSFARFCLILLPLLRILLDLLNNEIKINRFRSYTSSDKIHTFRWIFLNFQWAFKWSWNSESIFLFPLNFIGIFVCFYFIDSLCLFFTRF